MSGHRISVAVCTYNGEQYIREQLNSILGQTMSVDEIVIGDDGSTDRSLEIAEEILSKEKIRTEIIRNEINLGYRKNFENVIRHTTGDIVFLCDQDDVWLPEKVERMVEVMDRDPQCLLAFSDAFLTDGELNVKEGSLWDAVCYTECRSRFSDDWDLLLSGYYVTGAAACIRRSLFDRCDPFSEVWVHDGWLAVHALLYGKMQEVPEKLLYYRQHGNNQIGALAETNLLSLAKSKLKVLRGGSETLLRQHRDDRDRWKEFYDLHCKELPRSVREKIKNAVRMYSDLCKLPEQNFFRSIHVIASHSRKGDYQKYTKRALGAMGGDILFLSLSRKGKSV